MRTLYFGSICLSCTLHSVINLVRMQLKLLVRDSKKDSSKALAQVYDLVPVHNSVAIIGPASSTPTKDVCQWLQKMPEKERRLVIGYSATSTELSELTNFIRTPPADDAAARKMAALMAGSTFVCRTYGSSRVQDDRGDLEMRQKLYSS